MHVLSTVDAVGGVWTYALELARALPDVQFSFAQMGPRPNDAQRAEVETLSNLRLWESDFRLEWQENPWNDVAESGHWLRELGGELKVDVAHLNGFSHGDVWFMHDIPKIVVAHSCVLSWWQAVKGECAPIECREYERRVQSGLGAANAVVAPTRAFGREIERIYTRRPGVQTIHNGAAPFESEQLPREPFVLAAGRAWDEAKNFAVLEETAATVPIKLAGDVGEFRAKNIETLGRLTRDELQIQLARARVFAHPALYEPFGLSVLEAAQSGCALVLSDIPTLRELWDGAAIFCPPRDANDWTQTLKFLMNNEHECARLAERALDRAKKYSRDAFGAGYRALYERLTTR